MVSKKLEKVGVKQFKVKAGVQKEKSSGKKSVIKEVKCGELEQKEKLRRVRKNRKRSQSRRSKVKKQGIKLHTLNLLPRNSVNNLNEQKDEIVTDISKLAHQNSLKKCSLKELNASSSWGIMLAGIPKNWKGSLEDITQEYEKFNVRTCGITRQNFEKEICQVIYMYFTNKEDWKNAVLSGPRNFAGKSLILRTNPVRMVYISGIPLNVNEETVCLDLKNALGPTVYDISVPSRNGKKLGYAVAFVFDDDDSENVLNRVLNLWEKVQCCCSEADFFKKFVLNVLSGWENGCQTIIEELLETFHKMDIEVCVDSSSKKLFFTDESYVQKALKKSGMLIQEKKIILSRSSKASFVIKNISKSVKKNDIQNLLYGIKAYNLIYKNGRCKASFDVPIEEAEKCADLHQKEFFGRKLEVLQSGSEELKLSKEKSRKKFHELVTKSEESGKPVQELPAFAKRFQQLKKLKSAKRKRPSKNDEKKSKGMKKKSLLNKVKPSPLSKIVKMISNRK